MKIIGYSFLFFAGASLRAMDESGVKNSKHIQEIGPTLCQEIVNQWSSYEKRLLVTLFQQEKWPAHRKGAPIYFVGDKEVYPDRLTVVIQEKPITISMDDFKVLAGLDQIPGFKNYGAEIMRIDNLREQCATEKEVWEQLDLQERMKNAQEYS